LTGSTPATIAWIDSPDGGRWGASSDLALPLSDRGLLFADGLFETVLVEDSRPRLLEEHLERWRTTAAALGMEPPPDAEQVRELLREAVTRSGIRSGALRLNWSRGSGLAWARGIDLPGPDDPPLLHRFWLQLTAARPRFEPLRLIVSRTEQRNAASRISLCKTFAYGASIQARQEARAAGADDALLRSTAGGLCCGTTANLLLRRRQQW
jgi:branched-subunit amino acid aminotransferase/4-amino-4-deoxychorismate lyase